MADQTKLLEAFWKHQAQAMAKKHGVAESEIVEKLQGKGEYKSVTQTAAEFMEHCVSDAKRWRDK